MSFTHETLQAICDDIRAWRDNKGQRVETKLPARICSPEMLEFLNKWVAITGEPHDYVYDMLMAHAYKWVDGPASVWR